MSPTGDRSPIAIDTSVLLGFFDSHDAWHAPAITLILALEEANLTVFYFDCVLAEMISTLARRLREKRREADLGDLLSQVMSRCPVGRITWILPDAPALYAEAIEQVRTSEGELNFNDALIALSCRNRGIPRIASFDRDFDSLPWLARVAEPNDLAFAGSPRR